jgi:hypothetical protein
VTVPLRPQAPRRIAFLVLLFALVLFWRSPELLQNPRFWAEEGRCYYAPLQGADFFSTFGLIVRGNFQLLLNWIAYGATLVPARYAAHVTTYASLLPAAALAALVGAVSVQQRWPLALAGLIVVILALLPQGYEVYLTATNVQWILSVCVLLIAVIDAKNWKDSHRYGAYAFAAVSGLTGVCSAMLAPVFLVRRWISPSRPHFDIGLILGACAVVQAAVIVGHVHPDRSFPSSPLVLTLPVALQSILAPLIGAGPVDHLAALPGNRLPMPIWLVAIYCSSLLPAGFAVAAAVNRSGDRKFPMTLAAAWAAVSTLNVAGSIGDPAYLVSGWSGARYFFLGAVCFVLLLGAAASGAKTWSSRLATALLLAMLATGVTQRYLGAWKDQFTKGEPWQALVDRCASRRPCTVEAWPGGPGWAFELRRP